MRPTKWESNFQTDYSLSRNRKSKNNKTDNKNSPGENKLWKSLQLFHKIRAVLVTRKFKIHMKLKKNHDQRFSQSLSRKS